MSSDKRLEIETNRARRVIDFRSRLTAPPQDGGIPPGAAVTIELGCGHGHFLAAYAAAHPGEHCLGVDLLTKRIERCLRKRDRAGLHNLDFLKADAFEFVEAIPQGIQLKNIYLIHPDPWPKTRHHKNRLLQPRLLDLLANISIAGHTHLHFRTDHSGYHEWAASHLESHPSWRLLPSSPWPFEQETFFSKLLPIHHDLIAERV
ncbi:MAG: tRNA (guanosine(46)-N7)-methyltransferase TrmB [Puniceicoccales bacterium]|jgi:tRNA (guanine-N7-)-methyltransferase|nr:tRNA (guanosine(46)-N7)-methyltransferase TrmB [Puniceicoccales bacterium]